MSCPAHDVLIDYVDGALPPAGSAALERHLVACQVCRMAVGDERELIQRMRGVPMAPARGSDFMAGLLSVGDLPTEPLPIRRQAPATLSSHAPAQYVSARKPIGVAALAVVGCISAAVVAIHVPGDAAQTRMPITRTQQLPQVAPVERVVGFDAGVAGQQRP